MTFAGEANPSVLGFSLRQLDAMEIVDGPVAENMRQPWHFASVWGLLGFLAILGQAFWRLGPYAVHAIRSHLSAGQIVFLVGWVVFMTYSEGYRGFHKRFAPRFVARAMHLARRPRPLHVLFAPLFCMALFHATRRRLVVSWCLLVGIVLLIVLVRQLNQPWRGMVDAGVVLGLVVGAVSLVWHWVQALRGEKMPVSADLPGLTPARDSF